jgi:hypothetical protein
MHAARFEKWLGTSAAQATPLDVDRYIEEVERRESAKTHLWALAYYFDYLQRPEVAAVARERRRERIRSPQTPLRELVDVEPALLTSLATAQIRTAEALLAATATAPLLEELADRCEISPAALNDLRLLCEFTAIRGVKGTRARLYRNAVGSVAELATMSPDELIAAAEQWIASTDFAGTPPTPKEAAFTIAAAKKLAHAAHGSPL